MNKIDNLCKFYSSKILLKLTTMKLLKYLIIGSTQSKSVKCNGYVKIPIS